jgi:hypothetical protein
VTVRATVATVVYAAGAARIEHVPDAHLTEPADAVVRLTRGEGQSTYQPTTSAIWATGRPHPTGHALTPTTTRRSPARHRDHRAHHSAGRLRHDAGGSVQFSIEGLD